MLSGDQLVAHINTHLDHDHLAKTDKFIGDKIENEAKLYDELSSQYCANGMSLIQVMLMNSLGDYLCAMNKEFNKTVLMKDMAWISKQMMMREFEILLWACLNSEEHIRDTIEKPRAQKNIQYRMLMTAFYLKEKFSSPQVCGCIKAQLEKHFQNFMGRYTTEWLILEEPDLSKITPKVLNAKFCELKKLYEKTRYVEKINDDDDDDEYLNKDFNKLVDELGEEINRVDQLRRQEIERDVRRNQRKKRFYSDLVEVADQQQSNNFVQLQEKKIIEKSQLKEDIQTYKRQKPNPYQDRNMTPLIFEGIFDISPNKSITGSFTGYLSQIWNTSIINNITINNPNCIINYTQSQMANPMVDMVQKQASKYNFIEQINLSHQNDLSHSKSSFFNGGSNNRNDSLMNLDVLSIFSKFGNSKLIQQQQQPAQNEQFHLLNPSLSDQNIIHQQEEAISII